MGVGLGSKHFLTRYLKYVDMLDVYGKITVGFAERFRVVWIRTTGAHMSDPVVKSLKEIREGYTPEI